MDLVGIELEAVSRPERSGSLLPKSRAKRGTSPQLTVWGTIGGPGRDRTDDPFHVEAICAASEPRAEILSAARDLLSHLEERGPSFGFL